MFPTVVKLIGLVCVMCMRYLKVAGSGCWPIMAGQNEIVAGALGNNYMPPP